MKKPSPIVAIFFTIFFDMLSFGTVIPDLQIRIERMAHNGFLTGLTLALFSIAQFLFAPYLGRLSDRIGRRPVLVVTCALSVLAAAIYAYGTNLPVIWISRIFLGMAGANLAVAYAYISDISTPENRGKSMGVLGMAFGLGFMLGPPAGALLLKAGDGSPFLLGWCSALFAFINLLFVWFLLPESYKGSKEDAGSVAPNRIRMLWQALQTPTLGHLLVLFFVANFAFTNLESTFYRVGQDIYHVDQLQTTWVLIFVGLVAAVMQGAIMRLLLPKFGETWLLRAGYILQSPAILSIPLVPWGPLVFLGALVLGVGSGMAQPSLTSLISRSAPPAMVGAVFGITQSLGSLARIAGPVIANSLFSIKPWAPYALGSALLLIPAVMAWRVEQPAPASSGVSA